MNIQPSFRDSFSISLKHNVLISILHLKKMSMYSFTVQSNILIYSIYIMTCVHIAKRREVELYNPVFKQNIHCVCRGALYE